tara:strand:+ start:1517 stop:1786 length:270 start_codon:yes stop_codon:yes gene_type:complete
MNINENKEIANAEPSLLEELRDGQHKDIVAHYKDEYNWLGASCSHEESIRNLVDDFRETHKVTHTTATRCIHEILWEQCGMQTTKEEQA